MVDNSRIKQFYKLPFEERLKIIANKTGLNEKEIELLKGCVVDEIQEIINGMIENVVGTFPMPIGIATNFIIDGKERLITMVTEEPSVVAAASNAARIARKHGGFRCEPVKSLMIGQVQLVGLKDAYSAGSIVAKNKDKILELANAQDPLLEKLGGGAKDLETHVIETGTGTMLIVHLIVDCLDAMGANAVNTMAEAIAPKLEDITGGRAILRIISNLASYRIARCKATFDKDLLGGEEIVADIIEAYEFAEHNIFRAATHNKGIMNGITAVTRATGNDTRAVEAGAHAYAAINGKYAPLTRYWKDDSGNLVGLIEIPAAVGVIGGAIKTHPLARICLKIMEINSADELSKILAAVGLAQNLAALKALVSEGIQKGHMKLHARNIVKIAGIPKSHQDIVIKQMAKSGRIRVDVARQIFEELIKNK
ncbi:MAG: hydroxymethylglutaryl-CoA reductase, degradative [Promethearchaeota archaeon]